MEHPYLQRLLQWNIGTFPLIHGLSRGPSRAKDFVTHIRALGFSMNDHKPLSLLGIRLRMACLTFTF
ncbi:hypothetical protein ALPO108162_05375 [Alicyclobacillus pomorum]